MTDERLEEIRDRLAAARDCAAPPWWPGVNDKQHVFHLHEGDVLGTAPRVLLTANPHYDLQPVVALAGHAPQDIADLLEEVERLRRLEPFAQEFISVANKAGALV